MTEAARIADRVARDSYGRLVALLAARTRDIAAAEDALAFAFEKALSHWPRTGVPDRPEAWLMTTARNSLTDAARRRVRFPETPDIPESPTPVTDATFPDDRLALMCVCAHPAIAPDLHAPLILQTVLGLDVARIAQAFVLPAPTLAQRLVRAKRKIRDSGVSFALPDPDALPRRLTSLHEAIYAAHALDWLAPTDALGDEALYLADLLVRLCPEDAETKGLAALIAFGHARRDSRMSVSGFVPLDQQDPADWDKRLNAYALHMLNAAQRHRHPGRFQIEAAIQSVHVARTAGAAPDWVALDHLYTALQKTSPSLGAAVAHALVKAERYGPATGFACLDALPGDSVAGFQPYWAARFQLLTRDPRFGDARAAGQRAVDLATDPALRRWLADRLSRYRT